MSRSELKLHSSRWTAA